MDTYYGHFGVHPLHPFPARMAPSIAFDHIRSARDRQLTVLDPMAGSGTTVIAARREGHIGIGFDTDPLARLVAKVSVSDVDPERLNARALSVEEEARRIYSTLSHGEAYPSGADDETKAFIRYWFDPLSRRQLTALSRAIEDRGGGQKAALWCAFSRLIIAKDAGASLARDLSHSRPQKVYEKSPIKPLQEFVGEARFIAKTRCSRSDLPRHRRPRSRLPTHGGYRFPPVR